MSSLDKFLMDFLDSPLRLALAGVALAVVALAAVYRHEVLYLTRLIRRSLWRNIIRTSLTGLAVAALVFVVTLLLSVVTLLDRVTTEKTKDFKAIVTERWQIPSQLPYSYAHSLQEGGYVKPGDYRVDSSQDAMTWSFYGGTIDPGKFTRESICFFFCMDPDKFPKMMDGLDELTPEQLDQLNRACAEMKQDKTKVVVGAERLQALNKRVGERMKIFGTNYQNLDLEVTIIAALPPGRYGQSAVMNYDYLQDSLDAYKTSHQGNAHPLAGKTLNLVWIRVPDTRAFKLVSEQIMSSPEYTVPAVKCETASSGVASFLDAYRDLLWGMKWLLVPALLAAMSLVIANAISISVRERRPEMAVLKVLGFSPNQILILVLGEALLIGLLCGFLSAGLSWVFVNEYLGGIRFPIAFFPAFRISDEALWWGPAIGTGTALIGSVLPAWSARAVKVSEVFSKVA
jgi:putative ABC transport system permease protein